MNTALLTGNTYHSDCTSLLMSFEAICSDDKYTFDATAPGATTQNQNSRSRHLNLVGTPIDKAFGQIDILWKLDKNALERMAASADTPVIVLERLALHPHADVRAAVADNENTPLYTIWALSKDADADVRYQLAENHNLPVTLLRSLLKDENPYVACRAQKTYDRLQAQ